MQQLKLELVEKTAKYQQNLESHSHTISGLQEQLDQASRTIKDQNNILAEQKILLENATRDRDTFEAQA